ncbi:MAG: hypothetical protein ABSG25_07870 [Bryobacteraceae bacterium]
MTSLERYNVENYSQTEEYRIRQYQTKKKNHTHKSSKPEDDFELFLQNNNIDYIRNREPDERYPFVCDYYIPSKDLFIELNLYWTHGNKRYEGTNEDILQIYKWFVKNSDSYNAAIEVWSFRDVKKIDTAKNNNLNYITFYKYDEIKMLEEIMKF